MLKNDPIPHIVIPEFTSSFRSEAEEIEEVNIWDPEESYHKWIPVH